MKLFNLLVFHFLIYHQIIAFGRSREDLETEQKHPKKGGVINVNNTSAILDVARNQAA